MSIGLETAKSITAGVLAAANGGRLVPVPGGVLVKDAGTVVGCVGVSGDTSDDDELAAISGIESVSLVPQPD